MTQARIALVAFVWAAVCGLSWLFPLVGPSTVPHEATPKDFETKPLAEFRKCLSDQEIRSLLPMPVRVLSRNPKPQAHPEERRTAAELAAMAVSLLQLPPPAAEKPREAPVRRAPKIEEPEKRALRSTAASAPSTISAAEEREFPPIVADYDEIGFRPYLQVAVREAGAGVFVGETERERLVAEVDVENGGLRPLRASLNGLATGRPRRLRDPAAEPFLQQARKELGPGAYELFLFFPEQTEKRLVHALSEHLSAKGMAVAGVAHLRGRYRLQSERLRLVLTEAVQKDGRTVALQCSVDVSGSGHAD